MDSGQLKKMALEVGADLVGIAPIERFESLAAERNPISIAPECRSVVVLGRRILRGSLRGVEEGTNFGSTYNMFGYSWLEDNFLSQSTYDLTCWVEEQGFEAVPLFGYNEEGMPKGRPVAEDKPAPNVYVDIEFAAQAAGLGEVGLGGFFITPEYGTRQRLALILTDAELSPDDIFDKQICTDCGACAEACPFGAIDVDNLQVVGVPGHTMNVATVDYDLCRDCPNGAVNAAGRGSRPDRLAAVCCRACLVRLENADKCGNAFEQPFRKRPVWILDSHHRPISATTEAKADKLGCDGGTRV